MRSKLIGAVAIAATIVLPTAAALAQAGPPPGATDDWRLHHRGAPPPPHGGYAGGDHWRHHGYGAAVGAGIAGLAAGALLGGALTAPQPGYYPPPADDYYATDGYRPPEAYPAESPDAEDYCFRTYRSYDPASGTYLGNDGYRHPCP